MGQTRKAGIRGRGAPANWLSQRFQQLSRVVDGDWLDVEAVVDGPPPKLRTTVTAEYPRTIINKVRSPDLPFDRSINIYRGCEHGCIYCFARPTHAHHDLSPGLDFETRLFAKPDAPKLLRQELSAPNYQVRPLAIGTNTDPYQPIEREYRLMRACLEVLAELRHPVMITTKSDRVVQDIDLLQEMAALGLVTVTISVTSLEPEIARTLEPRAPHPEKRLAAVTELSAAGVPVCVNMAPLIPQITDHEIEHLVARAASAGAYDVHWIALRLPHEVLPLFQEWLEVHFPDRGGKVMATIRSLRGGRYNEPDFHRRMRGEGVWGALIARRMELARCRAGLGRKRPALRTDLFQKPLPATGQLSLF